MDKFWLNKKVLITGHTGFCGSWLCLILKQLGANVTGYSLDIPSKPSMFDLCGIDKIIDQNIYNDIRNDKALKILFKKEKFDVVFHLAAQPIVIESYKNPINTYETNVLGTVNLLDACKDNDIKSIVCITTDKVYKNKELFGGYRESDDLGGFDPYSASKACCEFVIDSYRYSYDINVASCRAGNVIGGGDFGQYRLIPDVIGAVEKKEVLKIRNPLSVRPWQHVLDLLSGYLNLAQKLYNNKSYAQAWNFSSNEKEIKVVDILDRFKVEFDFIYEIEKLDYHETKCLKLDSSKSNKLLDWKSKLYYTTMFDLTVSWYRNYLDNKNMLDYTMDQIKDYYEDSLCKKDF